MNIMVLIIHTTAQSSVVCIIIIIDVTVVTHEDLDLRLYGVSHSLSLLKESPILSRCPIIEGVLYMIGQLHQTSIPNSSTLGHNSSIVNFDGCLHR